MIIKSISENLKTTCLWDQFTKLSLGSIFNVIWFELQIEKLEIVTENLGIFLNFMQKGWHEDIDKGTRQVDYIFYFFFVEEIWPQFNIKKQNFDTWF